MATFKQKKAVRILKGNIGKPMRGILLDAGYSPSISDNPKVVMESKGFIALMYSQGLTRELISSSLKEDIVKKPQNRVAELALGAKILKMTEEDKEDVTTPTLNIVVENVTIDNTVNNVLETQN